MVVWFDVDAGYRVTEALKVDESGSQPVAETVTETDKHVEELPSNDADAAMNVCFDAQAKKPTVYHLQRSCSCHGYLEISAYQRTAGFL